MTSGSADGQGGQELGKIKLIGWDGLEQLRLRLRLGLARLPGRGRISRTRDSLAWLGQVRETNREVDGVESTHRFRKCG